MSTENEDPNAGPMPAPGSPLVEDHEDDSEGQPEPPPPVDTTPNVRLAKSREGQALAEGTTNIGMTSVEIPDVASQLAGFYVESPGILVNQFPQYKFVQEKGSERPTN